MAVRIEDIKREGIAVDIDALARTGFESISEADRYRLKTQGVCAQKHVGVFMIRIRVPGGKMWPSQLRRVAELAATHGHGYVHVTTRAGLELHHVRIEHVPAVFAGLGEARSEEHTSELQSHHDLVCRLLLEKKKKIKQNIIKETNKKKEKKI